MGADDAILGVLATSPNRKIEGKKRLQKIIFLLKLGGLEIDADFEIGHYGPYSPALADTVDFLSLIGIISEQIKPIGVYNTLQSVYSLPSRPRLRHREAISPPERFSRIVQSLSTYSTVELEVAATIGYFTSAGLTKADAIARTKAMKPNKAIAPVLSKARDILQGTVGGS